VHKLQLLKAGIVLSYTSNTQRKLLFLFIIGCCIAMAISRAYTFKQVSLIFPVI